MKIIFRISLAVLTMALTACGGGSGVNSDDDKEVDMIEVGTKIIGNFGAMIPLSFGEVVAIETFDIEDEFFGVGSLENEVKVVWDEGDYTWLMESEINAAVGKLSPIGYYTEEVYYET